MGKASSIQRHSRHSTANGFRKQPGRFLTLPKTNRTFQARHASTEASHRGYNSAYEEALNLIQVDKKERLKMLERVDKEIARVQKGKKNRILSALGRLTY